MFALSSIRVPHGCSKISWVEWVQYTMVALVMFGATSCSREKTESWPIPPDRRLSSKEAHRPVEKVVVSRRR